MPPRVAALAGSCLLVLSSLLGAQPRDTAVPARPEFGGADRILQAIGYSEFTPDNSSTTYVDLVSGGRHSTVPNGGFVATPHLPSGAVVTYFELDYCDFDSATDVTAALVDCSFLLGGCTPHGSNLSSGAGNSGCQYVFVDLTSQNFVIDNNTRRYRILATTQSGSLSNSLIGVYIGYKLQVSPAPANATFLDVPTTHPQFRFVEALFASGITAGCGGSNFCPDQPLTRGQMAVFLAAALGLHFPN
jgi:hypothetical protein